jgi:hypothetical protein
MLCKNDVSSVGLFDWCGLLRMFARLTETLHSLYEGILIYHLQRFTHVLHLYTFSRDEVRFEQIWRREILTYARIPAFGAQRLV